MLVMLLPPTDREAEELYDADVRKLAEETDDSDPWLGGYRELGDTAPVNGCPLILRPARSPLLVVL